MKAVAMSNNFVQQKQRQQQIQLKREDIWAQKSSWTVTLHSYVFNGRNQESFTLHKIYPKNGEIDRLK